MKIFKMLFLLQNAFTCQFYTFSSTEIYEQWYAAAVGEETICSAEKQTHSDYRYQHHQ